MILQTAFDITREYLTEIIGEVTDLLVLALYLFKNLQPINFTCEPKGNNKSDDV